MAGLELAKELQLRGVDGVVVIESGPDGDRRHVNAVNDPTTALDMWLDSEAPAELWRPWQSATPPFYTRHGGLRRRLGGRSLYWHGVVLPIEPWALCAPWWPQSIVDDLTLSWSQGPSLYDRVQRELSAWRAQGAARSQRPPLRIGDRHLTPTPKAIRAVEGGGWEAYSPLSHWPPGTTGERQTALVTDAEVLGVLVDGGRVTGLRIADAVEGGEATLRCATVVLAAGTIESARLAIQARHDSTQGSAQPTLAGLVDHIEQGILVVLETDQLPADLAALASTDSSHHLAGDGDSRTHLFTRFYPLTGSAGSSVVLELFATGEQQRGEHSQVRCRTDAPWPWPTTIHAGLSGTDREVIEAGRQLLTEAWHDLRGQLGLPRREVSFPDFTDPDRTVADVLLSLDGGVRAGEPVGWSSLLGTVDHEAGTLPLGELLDERHEFTGIAGLHAVGPATFPRCGAANPSLTTLALSRRLAGLLADDCR
jgi:hypothetical protein